MTEIRYIFEAAFVYALYYFFKALSPERASGIGGRIMGFVGPKLATSRKARAHILLAFPDKSKKEVQDIILEMWENLGRVIAEYPHLENLGAHNVEIVGVEHMEKAIAQGQGGIFAGAHCGNWELCSAAVLLQYGHAPNLTYRAPNNPYLEGLLMRSRTIGGRLKAYPKARETGRKMLQLVKDKEYIGILLDQKYNEGITVPFFGEKAKTNPVAVQLSQKYGAPIVPAFCERVQGVQFKLRFFPPLETVDADGALLSAEDVMLEYNRILEDWISDHPGQWLWLHKRWSSEF